MAKFVPKVIDGEVIDVPSNATLADVVEPEVLSVTTVGGHLIPRSEFARHNVPDGFERNLTPQVKG